MPYKSKGVAKKTKKSVKSPAQKKFMQKMKDKFKKGKKKK